MATNASETQQGISTSTKRIALASGKRKTAVATAVVKPGTGIVRINGRRLEAIENKYIRELIAEPLLLIGKLRERINIKVRVKGGGFSGQAQAARTAIAKAIVQYFDDPKIEKLFRKYDKYLLVADPRRKEMKKYGGPGARARFQKSYR